MMMFHRRLVVAVVLGSLLAVPRVRSEGVSGAGHLRLFVDTNKATYALYEPVLLHCSVENPSHIPVGAYVNMDMAAGTIRLTIIASDGVRVPYWEGGIRDEIHVERVLMPGETVSGQREMRWNSRADAFAFPAPGSYRVLAEMGVGNYPDPVILEAETGEFTITEPVGLDKEALEYIAARGSFGLLMTRGPKDYCEGRPGPSCFEELRGFVEKYEGSAYGPFLMWDLAGFVASGLLDVTPKNDLAIDLLERIRNRHREHPVFEGAMIRLERVLRDAGRVREALEVEQELKAARSASDRSP